MGDVIFALLVMRYWTVDAWFAQMEVVRRSERVMLRVSRVDGEEAWRDSSLEMSPARAASRSDWRVVVIALLMVISVNVMLFPWPRLSHDVVRRLERFGNGAELINRKSTATLLRVRMDLERVEMVRAL
jgi:hypothetical protein